MPLMVPASRPTARTKGNSKARAPRVRSRCCAAAPSGFRCLWRACSLALGPCPHSLRQTIRPAFPYNAGVKIGRKRDDEMADCLRLCLVVGHGARRRRPKIPGRPVLAKTAAEQLDHGRRRPASRSMAQDHVWVVQRPQHADRRREGREPHAAANQMLRAGAAGDGVRSGGQSASRRGAAKARATTGRRTSTASTSIRKASSGSPATASTTATS